MVLLELNRFRADFDNFKYYPPPRERVCAVAYMLRTISVVEFAGLGREADSAGPRKLDRATTADRLNEKANR